MERYQELLNAFDVQVIDNHEFVQDNLTITQKLVIELQNYLGLSESKGASDAPLLQFLKIDPQTGVTSVPDLQAALLNAPEGRFHFGLGLLLYTNGEPKTQQYATFTFQCDRNLEDRELRIVVLDQTFEMNFFSIDELNFGEVCSHIFEALREGLNWRISDEIEKTKVGFDISPAQDTLA